MEIIPLGDSALIIGVSAEYDINPDKAADVVLDTIRRLKAAKIPGVIELTPAYETVAVFVDPLGVIDAGAPAGEVLSWLDVRIRKELEGAASKKAKPLPSRTIEIPVCYNPEFGPDLDDVAQHANRTPDEVVRLHSKGKYRVSCLGFTPGFPFLSGLASELATPRRIQPRKAVPGGSVAIGGKQTGIYPLQSPGGWNVIGRTPLRIFDITHQPPALLRAGDAVRFRAVTRDEYESLKA